MRKILSVIILMIASVSCSKLDENLSEISINATTVLSTKGFVDGETLVDTDMNAARAIYVSTYDNTTSRNYFVGHTFYKPEGATLWSNYKGSTKSPDFWTPAGKLDFLAYSASESTPAAVWNSDRAVSGVELTISEDGLKDDILYASATGCRSTDGSVSLQFRHTQAWVELRFKSELSTPVKIIDLVYKNVYTSGKIKIENKNSAASCKWNFSEDKTSDYKFAPEQNILEGTGEGIAVSLLLPQQKASDFEVKCLVNGITKTISINNNVPNWDSGRHYVYNISLNELTTKSSPVESETCELTAKVKTSIEYWQ